MNKRSFMPLISLTVICIAVAALMAIVNTFTAPKIKENAIKAEQEALFLVLPSEEDGFDSLSELEGLPGTVKAVYKAKGGSGHVVSLATSTNYSSDDMVIIVGIGTDGKITGINLNSYAESKDFGKESYPPLFVGKDLNGSSEVPIVSGVTYSSTAFKDAIADAFVAVGIALGEQVDKPDTSPDTQPTPPSNPLPKTDDEILSVFEEMAGKNLTLEAVYVSENSVGLKKLYKDTENGGCYAYIVTSTQWVPVETEGAVYINADAKVEKVKLLNWTVGHGVNYTQDYLDSFIGTDKWNGNKIDIVSGATGTSDHFKNAVLLAVSTADSVMQRSESVLISQMQSMVQNEKGFEKMEIANAPETLKALYRETSGKGFIAYTVTRTQWVDRETEALTYIDPFGRIVAVRILTWTVGHGVDYTDDFLNSFVGKTADSLEQTELVSAATSTSQNLRDAIGAALNEVPVRIKSERIVSAVLLILLVGAFVSVLVYNKRKRRARK